MLSRHNTGGNVSLPPTQSSVSNGNGSSSLSSSATDSSMVAGGAGAGTSTTPAQQLPQSGFAFQIIIPCSVDIVGETLGTKFSGMCRDARVRGSSPGGVPVAVSEERYHAARFHRSDSTRDRRAWSKGGKEPLRATIQSWIDFINNPSNWNGRIPVPAGVAGGLSVKDFEKRLPAAPV